MSKETITTAMAAICALGLLTAGVGAVTATSSGDLGAGYLAYKALNNDLNADSVLAGGSAVLGGAGVAMSGAGTYVGASGAAAILGAGAAVTGGALVL